MIKLRNPRTGVIDAEYPIASTQALDQTAQDLRTAQPRWAARAASERAQVLLQFTELLASDQALLDALINDTGRVAISRLEVRAVVGMLRRWSSQAPEILAHRHAGHAALTGVRYETFGQPYPLIGVISPWNFPLLLSMIDTIPALLAGCAVWVKPSEVACRFIQPLRAIIACIPALHNVLHYEYGAGLTGAEIITRSDAICFTGSVNTGRRVYQLCAQQFIPVFLELGGKDPLIVLPDSDLDLASDVALRASVIATGQACQSIERIYVHQAQHDAFVQCLSAKAAALQLNYPDIHQGQIGPLIFAGQAETIAEHLRDALALGARIHCGGKIEHHGGGSWIRPTLLTGVTHQMKIMREESFGPLLPVMPYNHISDAVHLANDSDYGLSAAVIGPDAELCERVAHQLDVGAVSINDAALTSVVYEAEKQAFRQSGLGASRMGAAGLNRFLRKKALIWQTGSPLPLSMMDEV